MKTEEVKCDTCDGQGWVLGVDTESGHAEGCWGNCAKNGCPVPVQVQVQETCEDCQGRGSIEWTHG